MSIDRKGALLAILVGVVLAGLATFFAFRPKAPQIEISGNVSSATCAGCHQEIFNAYRASGMGRSLYRPDPQNKIEDFQNHNTLYHQASDRTYTMSERNGQFFQQRRQTGFTGEATNIVEKEINLVIGSGNHARTYLHRDSDGTLIELPVSWYSEQGGYWAMSPGYDRPTHPDFRRAISGECLFCHAGYPVQSSVPEAIDCQRCHGPGRAHADAAGSGHATPERIRRAIVNPARLSRDRQLDTCMQCHLETTSRQLPHSIRRYNRDEFSYQPGEPLGDYLISFDHAPGTGHDDKFEIAHAAYRLRKSKCFLGSQMTCTTCHDPHRQETGENAVSHYVAACRTCHVTPHSSDNCMNCHMPKRRAEDAVHAVMTDHYIQRRPSSGNLLAPHREADFARDDVYRGEVVLYYPAQLSATTESQLYLDIAQVADSANLEGGIPRLRQDIGKYQPTRPEFYFELAEAYSKAGNQSEAIRWYDESLRRGPGFRPAMEALGLTLMASGNLPRAAEVLEKAAADPSPQAEALVNLGIVYLKQGKLEPAIRVVLQAFRANPDLPEAHNLAGLLSAQAGDRTGAERSYRNAILNQPDFAEAHYNLANLLAGAGNYPEAQFHFEKAIASQPSYMEAHHNYGNLLFLTRNYAKALVELREAVRLAPNFGQAHTDLADVLVAQGQLDGAAVEYLRAVQLNPEDYQAHLSYGAILARKGNVSEARAHFAKASESPDPDVRQAAQKALR